jgi:Cu+-exporting ATPase
VTSVSLQTETLHVSGIRCERCVGRLAGVLRGMDGLESANANLAGELTLSWDERRLDRATLVTALARAGFRETPRE